MTEIIMVMIFIFCIGIACGIYIASQIEKSIDNNIKKNNESDRAK